MRHVGHHGKNEDSGGGGEADDARGEESCVGGREERRRVARIQQGHREKLQNHVILGVRLCMSTWFLLLFSYVGGHCRTHD